MTQAESTPPTLGLQTPLLLHDENGAEVRCDCGFRWFVPRSAGVYACDACDIWYSAPPYVPGRLMTDGDIKRAKAPMPTDTTPRTPGLEERLRKRAVGLHPLDAKLLHEAADEIAHLTADLEALLATVKERTRAGEIMTAKIERLQRRIAAGQDALNPEGADR